MIAGDRLDVVRAFERLGVRAALEAEAALHLLDRLVFALLHPRPHVLDDLR